eukprot:CAMPEP_0113244310 /NCGR_PEP_ID=MMETSP0008_2-20120614/8328_1 /TAXON_ID=97485 /ORGANISM="Prymnesium parvum" /LENGTH=60 /DNA_ID=CAMNT_0000091909 /DNA_START=317 /DNA_END=496 /DNA_ORIENTATION=- /assembly_acc=CAM_ASM_000153
MPIGIRRAVVEVDEPGDALEPHPLDQRAQQLFTFDLTAVLNLDQVVQSMGDCEHRVEAEW